MIKYTIYPMTAYPSTIVKNLLMRRSFLHCLFFCPVIKLSSSGLKSLFIRGAVFSNSVRTVSP